MLRLVLGFRVYKSLTGNLRYKVKAMLGRKRCWLTCSLCLCFSVPSLQIYDKFVALVAEKVSALKVGDGLQPDTNMGPLISPAAVDKVNMLQGLGFGQCRYSSCGLQR